MTSPTSFSPHDLELISAFLDGSLASGERRDFLTRLQHEPALRQAVAEIQAVREELRHLPPVRVPRGFRLTREMISPVRASRAQPTRYFGWGSAAAALALALLVFLDLSSSPWLAAQSVPAAAPAALARAASSLATPPAPAIPSAPTLAAAPLLVSPPPGAESLSSPSGAGQPTPTQASATAAASPSSGPNAIATSRGPATLPPLALAHVYATQTNLPPQARFSAPPPATSIISSSRSLLRGGELILALATAALAVATLVSRRPRR